MRHHSYRREHHSPRPRHHHSYRDRPRTRSGGSHRYTSTTDRFRNLYQQHQDTTYHCHRNAGLPAMMTYGHGNRDLPFFMHPGTSGPQSHLITNTSLLGNQSHLPDRWHIREQETRSSMLHGNSRLQESLPNDRLQENSRQNNRYEENQSYLRYPNSSTHDRFTQQHTMQGSLYSDARPPNIQWDQQHPEDMSGIKMTKLPFFQIIGTPLQIIIRSTGPTWTSHALVMEDLLLEHFRGRRLTSPYEVHIRFCRYDQRSEQKDYFPSDLQVKVNGQLCLLPGWNVIPKGPATPIEITSKCDFQRHHNVIDVRTSECLAMFIHITRRLNHEDLLQKLLMKSPIDPSTTVARIQKLQQDSVNGADITLTSLQFSLMCPVSKARMKLPCRASTCQHLQCFDAAYYLQMNEKKPKWICPVCSNEVEYENLQIDGHFKNILEQNISTEKILLEVDGSCIPFQPKDVDKSILTLDDTLDHSSAEDEDPHSTDKEPHSTDGKELHSADANEPHSTDGKELHSADYQEPHSTADRASHPTNTEQAHHITIDLLSEDDSLVSVSEDKVPVLSGTDCASSKGTQNNTGAEVVILSDDEPCGTPYYGPSLPLPSQSCRELSPEGSTSSTPRSHKHRKRKHKSKKTPKTKNVNTTSIDRPGTRMVLRSHVRRTNP